MQLTIQVKLITDDASRAALLETMREFNIACDCISEAAYYTGARRVPELHRLTYFPVRSVSLLTGTYVCQAMAKVAASYKRNPSVEHSFRPLGAIRLHKDAISWKVESQSISISVIGGRAKLHYTCSARQQSQLTGKRGQPLLSYRNGQFYLVVPIETSCPETFIPTGVIGVDMGMVNVATDSEGNVHTGEPIKRTRRRFRRIRQLLQPNKTRSARKHLQKVHRKESRFVRNENHRISKQLVQLALDRQKALACESLTGIRGRGNSFNRAMRTELNEWSFYQLKSFIGYKCQLAGVPLVEVDPRYSSQECSRCHHIERGNRKSQEHFCCLSCGFQENADLNAAFNLRARGELSDALMFRA